MKLGPPYLRNILKNIFMRAMLDEVNSVEELFQNLPLRCTCAHLQCASRKWIKDDSGLTECTSIGMTLARIKELPEYKSREIRRAGGAHGRPAISSFFRSRVFFVFVLCRCMKIFRSSTWNYPTALFLHLHSSFRDNNSLGRAIITMGTLWHPRPACVLRVRE